MKGFSPRNLKYMRAFAEAWPEPEFVQEVLAQLSWYHQLALLDKLRTDEERRWYAANANSGDVGDTNSEFRGHPYSIQSAANRPHLLF